MGVRVAPVSRQEQQLVVGDGLVQRRAVGLPVGQQLGERARVHDGARQDVRAGLGALLEHDDRDLLACLGGQLLQADGGGQAGGAAADDHDVVFHGFARAELGEDFFGVMAAFLGNGRCLGRRSGPIGRAFYGASRQKIARSFDFCAACYGGTPSNPGAARRRQRGAVGPARTNTRRETIMGMKIDLSGRVAFVTGASSGLGAQFAQDAGRAGAGVVLAAAASRS